jgi:GT2 family glycosyltransferase
MQRSSGLYSLRVLSAKAIDPGKVRPVGVIVLRLGSHALSDGLTEALHQLHSDGLDVSILVAENPDGREVVDLNERIVDRTIRFASNVGYAAAVNEAVRQQPSHCQIILVLTSDITLARGSFSALVSAVSDPTIGVVAPQIQTGDETWLGGTWSQRWGWARHRVVSGVHEPPHTHGYSNTTWADGSCLVFHRSVFETIGGFDERTFLYGEDLVFCLKVHQLGQRVVIANEVVARQESGMTQRSGAHGYLLIRNEVLAAQTMSEKFPICVAISGATRVGLELTRAATRPTRKHHLKQSLGMALGLIDSLRGRYGPPPEKLARWARIPCIDR